MMHGPEKSDFAIVAVKPANKAASAAAEWVEPRAGTKGNADPPRTQRTQGRASVSPGLDRVRHAARQRKKEKFTALLHHVTIDLLRDAFLALKRRAAPGVDGVTWQDYEADLEGNLQDLHARVHRGTSGQAAVYTEAGHGHAAPAGHRRAGRQDRPARGRCGAQRDLRGDFLGFSYGCQGMRRRRASAEPKRTG